MPVKRPCSQSKAVSSSQWPCPKGLLLHHKDGKTPLDLASEEGQVDVAHMLIEHGVDLTAQTYGGETPLHLASRH